ncbi:unnamed protein product [Dicrocoelium dendriticum]|nr:unnamed protein product [Dicrocoelium dendriticum]
MYAPHATETKDQLTEQCATNGSSTSVQNVNGETPADYSGGLFVMMFLLTCILFMMVILLLLPKSVQDAIFRWISCQGPDASFNYIDVGLYKTRHSMYRKEVYSLAMQRNHLKGTNKLPGLTHKDNESQVEQWTAGPKSDQRIYTGSPSFNLGTILPVDNKQKVKLTITITPDNLPDDGEVNPAVECPVPCVTKPLANKFDSRSAESVQYAVPIINDGRNPCSSLPDLSYLRSEREISSDNSKSYLEPQHSLPDSSNVCI